MATYETSKSVWPDLAKFGHLGKTLKAFGYSLRLYFVFGKILTLIGQIFMILDKISLLIMAQYWKDNLAIWSHCSKCTPTRSNHKDFSRPIINHSFKHIFVMHQKLWLPFTLIVWVQGPLYSKFSCCKKIIMKQKRLEEICSLPMDTIENKFTRTCAHNFSCPLFGNGRDGSSHGAL